MTKLAAQIPATSPAYGKEKDMPHLLKVCPSKLITLFLILFHWPKCSYVIPTCHLFDPPGPLPIPLHVLSVMGGWPVGTSSVGDGNPCF